MADNTGIGLPEVIDAIRRRWVAAVLVALPIFIGVVAYTERLPSSYDGKAIVALTPRPGANVGADIIRVLGPKYVAYVTAPATLRQVAPQIGMAPGELDGLVDAQVSTDSANVTITAHSRSPQRAADAANAMAATAVRFSEDDKLLSASIVSPALVPTSPSRPRRKLIEASGLLVAMLVGVVASLVIERGRPRVRVPMEVAYVTGHAVIGRIPRSRSVRSGPEGALGDPLVGGAVRSLRTFLDQEGRAAPIHALAVTSSVAGEGKSTVASSLAAAIARLDARVLLIDADLRRPNVAATFGMEPEPGLVDALNGTIPFDRCIRPAKTVAGLNVLPTRSDIDAGDLLARQFYAVLSKAREQFDVVVVDCPPLLATDDARTVATLCDAVLLVVAAGTETRSLGEASQVLDSLGVRVIGAVMNRLRGRADAYVYGQATSSRRR